MIRHIVKHAIKGLRNIASEIQDEEFEDLSGIREHRRRKPKRPGIKPHLKLVRLNHIDKESDAFLQAKVHIGKDGYDVYDYALTIHDCEQKVILHGSLSTPESRANAIHKLTTICNEVQSMIAHIESECERLDLKVETDKDE